MLRDKWLPPPASPGQGLLLPILVLGDPGSLPRLRDVAAAVPSTSSEADTDTHRGHGHGWSHRRPPAAPTFRTHTDTGTDSHIPSSSWAGRGRRSLVQHTLHTLQIHKHTHICGSPEQWYGPSAHPAPLLTYKTSIKQKDISTNHNREKVSAKFTTLYYVMI